jgi:Mor family transcriptional regulator
MNDGRTMEYAINKLIGKYGYSESTIYQIIKRIGKYKD